MLVLALVRSFTHSHSVTHQQHHWLNGELFSVFTTQGLCWCLCALWKRLDAWTQWKPWIWKQIIERTTPPVRFHVSAHLLHNSKHYAPITCLTDTGFHSFAYRHEHCIIAHWNWLELHPPSHKSSSLLKIQCYIILVWWNVYCLHYLKAQSLLKDINHLLLPYKGKLSDLKLKLHIYLQIIVGPFIGPFLLLEVMTQQQYGDVQLNRLLVWPYLFYFQLLTCKQKVEDPLSL